MHFALHACVHISPAGGLLTSVGWQQAEVGGHCLVASTVCRGGSVLNWLRHAVRREYLGWRDVSSLSLCNKPGYLFIYLYLIDNW